MGELVPRRTTRVTSTRLAPPNRRSMASLRWSGPGSQGEWPPGPPCWARLPLSPGVRRNVDSRQAVHGSVNFLA